MKKINPSGCPQGVARFDARQLDDYPVYDYETHERIPKKPKRKKETRKLRHDEVGKPFKCRRCKAFVGTPVTGGRHRNHCPACLYSLHVDGKTPGDRKSDCRSLMEPVGTFSRPNGEQVLLHRCRGCGLERHCRIAADDNPVRLMRLPLLVEETFESTDQDKSAIACDQDRIR